MPFEVKFQKIKNCKLDLKLDKPRPLIPERSYSQLLLEHFELDVIQLAPLRRIHTVATSYSGRVNQSDNMHYLTNIIMFVNYVYFHMHDA